MKKQPSVESERRFSAPENKEQVSVQMEEVEAEIEKLYQQIRYHNAEVAPKLEDRMRQILGSEAGEEAVDKLLQRKTGNPDFNLYKVTDNPDRRVLAGVEVGAMEGLMGAGRKLKLIAEITNGPEMQELGAVTRRLEALEGRKKELQLMLIAYEKTGSAS